MSTNDVSTLQAFGLDMASEPDALTNGGRTIRPNPLPHFFVAYGLAFEIISRSFGNPAALKDSLAAARALQTLVQPIYSGAALFTSSVFDELCTICYRIALGEGALLKAEMVKIMQAYATSRGISGDQDQLRRVVAVIAYTLRSAIGSAGTPSSCEFGRVMKSSFE
jgi:hypothetical protein